MHALISLVLLGFIIMIALWLATTVLSLAGGIVVGLATVVTMGFKKLFKIS